MNDTYLLLVLINLRLSYFCLFYYRLLYWSFTKKTNKVQQKDTIHVKIRQKKQRTNRRSRTPDRNKKSSAFP